MNAHYVLIKFVSIKVAEPVNVTLKSHYFRCHQCHGMLGIANFCVIVPLVDITSHRRRPGLLAVVILVVVR